MEKTFINLGNLNFNHLPPDHRNFMPLWKALKIPEGHSFYVLFFVQYIHSLCAAKNHTLMGAASPKNRNNARQQLMTVQEIKKVLRCQLCQRKFQSASNANVVTGDNQEVQEPEQDERKDCYFHESKYYAYFTRVTCSACQQVYCNDCRAYRSHGCTGSTADYGTDEETQARMSMQKRRFCSTQKNPSIFHLIFQCAANNINKYYLNRLIDMMEREDDLFSSARVLNFLMQQVTNFRHFLNRALDNNDFLRELEAIAKLESPQEYRLNENERISNLQMPLILNSNSNELHAVPRLWEVQHILEFVKTMIVDKSQKKQKRLENNFAISEKITILSDHCILIASNDSFLFYNILFIDNTDDNSYFSEISASTVAPYFRMQHAFACKAVQTIQKNNSSYSRGTLVSHQDPKVSFQCIFLKSFDEGLRSAPSEIFVPCWGIEYICLGCSKMIGQLQDKSRLYCGHCNQYFCENCRDKHQDICADFRNRFFSLTSHSITTRSRNDEYIAKVSPVGEASGFFGLINIRSTKNEESCKFVEKTTMTGKSGVNSGFSIFPGVIKNTKGKKPESLGDISDELPKVADFAHNTKKEYADKIENIFKQSRVEDVKIEKNVKCCQCKNKITETSLQDALQKIQAKKFDEIYFLQKKQDGCLLCQKCNTKENTTFSETQLVVHTYDKDDYTITYSHFERLNIDFISENALRGAKLFEEDVRTVFNENIDTITDEHKNIIRIYMQKCFILNYVDVSYDVHSLFKNYDKNHDQPLKRGYILKKFEEPAYEQYPLLSPMSLKIHEFIFSIDEKDCVFDKPNERADLSYICTCAQNAVDTVTESDKLFVFISFYMYLQQYEAWRNTRRFRTSDNIKPHNLHSFYPPCRPVESDLNGFFDTDYDYNFSSSQPERYTKYTKYLTWMLFMDEIRARYVHCSNFFFRTKQKEIKNSNLSAYLFFMQPLTKYKTTEIGLLKKDLTTQSIYEKLKDKLGNEKKDRGVTTPLLNKILYFSHMRCENFSFFTHFHICKNVQSTSLVKKKKPIVVERLDRFLNLL